LKKRGIQIRDRVYQILEKYNSYEIIIEGDTDDGVQRNISNLSEKRQRL
jgi:outer membrane protein OmpA-like peptidoglycan-associated protein